MRRCLLFLFLTSNPFLAECACGTLMPYSSMVYLDQTLLTRYGLTDPCTVTCTAGYTGDFCQNQVPFFSSLPLVRGIKRVTTPAEAACCAPCPSGSMMSITFSTPDETAC